VCEARRDHFTLDGVNVCEKNYSTRVMRNDFRRRHVAHGRTKTDATPDDPIPRLEAAMGAHDGEMPDNRVHIGIYEVHRRQSPRYSHARQ